VAIISLGARIWTASRNRCPGVVFSVLQQYSLERDNSGDCELIVEICRWSKSPIGLLTVVLCIIACTILYIGQRGAGLSAEQLGRAFHARVDSRTSGFWRWATTCYSANWARRRSRSVCSSADESMPFAIAAVVDPRLYRQRLSRSSSAPSIQIQLTPEQLAALTTIAGAVAAFAGSYFATNSPVVQDVEQSQAAVPVKLPDSATVRPAEQPVAAVPTGVVETPAPKVVSG
jgi:hypothetical protein